MVDGEKVLHRDYEKRFEGVGGTGCASTHVIFHISDKTMAAMTERNYDYESRRSTTMMNQIRRFIFDASKRKRTPGATQREIANKLGMTVTGVGRYLAYMCENGMIHVTYPDTTQRGHQPASYVFGPTPPSVQNRKRTIFNDPLMSALYGRTE
jgi:hypothetical protein